MTPTPVELDPEMSTIVAYDLIAGPLARDEYRCPFFVDDKLLAAREPMTEDPRALDLGCGTGRLIPILREIGIHRVVGIDASREFLRIARENHPRSDFRMGNILSLREAVGEERFDAFFAIASLMHIERKNMPRAAASIREVLTTGAIGFISTHRGSDEIRIDARVFDQETGSVPEGHYILRVSWEREALGACFEKAGFSVIGPPFVNYQDQHMVYLIVRAI